MSRTVQQAPGLWRTDLQRHVLAFPAGVRDRRPPAKTYVAGEVSMVPAETIHAVTNVGDGNAAELATYVVEKGKPFLVVVE
jgi:hypothetical protein